MELGSHRDPEMTTIPERPIASPAFIVARSWRRVPLVLRAALEGFAVFAILGSFVGIAILMAIPAPWSALLLGVLLGAYVLYFSGHGPPASTTAIRRWRFRRTTLSRPTWVWASLGAALAVLAMQAGLVVTFRLFEFPSDAWTFGADLESGSTWAAWLTIVMASLLAGITEEVGLRGYAQVPLEERHGPTWSVLIVSIVFVLMHLNQAWASPSVLPLLFGTSVLWGILARSSASLIPSILSHAAADVFNFSYWWTDVAGSFDHRPISETGIDEHIVIWAALLVASLTLFAWAMRRLAALAPDLQLEVPAPPSTSIPARSGQR